MVDMHVKILTIAPLEWGDYQLKAIVVCSFFCYLNKVMDTAITILVENYR